MESHIGIVQPQSGDLAAEELAAVEKLQASYHGMKSELAKVIVGQEGVIEELLIALFCRGHALLVGVPGLAKTLLISTLSRTLGLSFNRIQFTPDLMPSDITGTEVIEEDKTTGGRQLAVRARAGFCQRDSGRRDQPHAAQDAGGAAGSDAGASGDGRRQAASAAAAVFRAGDAEPDRAGRHVSAAGSAARPVHVQHQCWISDARRRSFRSSG